MPHHTAGRGIPGRLLILSKEYAVTLLLVPVCLLLSLVPQLAAWATWYHANPLGFSVAISHYSHWSVGHLAWDLLAFAVLAAVLESIDRRLLIRLLLWVPPAIITMLWLTGTHESYRGLSGLDCGLYTALLILLWKLKRINPAVASCGLMLVILKSLYEIITGDTILVSDLPAGISGVPMAHLAGAVMGALLPSIGGMDFSRRAVTYFQARPPAR